MEIWKNNKLQEITNNKWKWHRAEGCNVCWRIDPVTVNKDGVYELWIDATGSDPLCMRYLSLGELAKLDDSVNNAKCAEVVGKVLNFQVDDVDVILENLQLGDLVNLSNRLREQIPLE